MKTRTSFIAKDTRFTVEETPIEIGTIECEFEVECSVQEMAQSGSTLMNVMKFVKDSIKEAQDSAQHAYDRYPKVEVKAAEPKVAEPKEVNYRINLKGTFEVLEGKLNGEDAWKSDGFGNLVYEKDDTNVAIHLKNEKIQIDIHVNDNHYHLHVYEDHMYISGFSAVYAEKFFKELKAYGATDIWELIKKVNKEED